VTLSPSWGMVTETGMALSYSFGTYAGRYQP
jgi:hypothetical protein